jgi:hypothetical protein
MKSANGRAYRGIVRKGVVHLEGKARLKEGSKVLVTPLGPLGDPNLLAAAVRKLPRVKAADVDELTNAIRRARSTVRVGNPLG